MTNGFRTEQSNGIAIWTFDRPEVRNAIDETTVDELAGALEQAENDVSLRAVVLTGAGESSFVSGADLKFLRDASPERRARNDTRMLELMGRIEGLPVPVIGALNGAVVGGGTEVALACDLRIAEPHSIFTMKHASLGISPGWGGLARLASLVGRSAACRLLLTALPMPPEEALRIGLVDEIVAQGGAKARALELAHAVAKLSPTAVAETKRLLSHAYSAGPAQAMEAERALFVALSAGQEHRDALTAVLERRTPAFKPNSRA